MKKKSIMYQIDLWQPDQFAGPIDAIIKNLQEIEEDAKSMGASEIRVEVFREGDIRDIEYEIVAYREETDEEFTQRKLAEEKAKATKAMQEKVKAALDEKRERELLAQLKAKYEG